MEALPYNTDFSFIPLDGGPVIPDAKGEVIVQNTGPSSFGPVPEPASAALLGVGLLGLGMVLRTRRG
jgi:hypothetical protein